MILYDSRAANSPSPRIRRAKTPFARCPCTKPAICAGAVNHPHHINCVNHSSNKCQRALAHALIPVQPLQPPQKGHQRGPCAAARLPSCAESFFAQSLVNSRTSLVHALIPVNPFHPPHAARTRPPRPRARPSPAAASAVMRPKILAQSHTFSRNLSSNAPASLPSVDTSKHWTKRRLLQAACGKNPTAIRPVLMHEDRDLRRRR